MNGLMLHSNLAPIVLEPLTVNSPELTAGDMLLKVQFELQIDTFQGLSDNGTLQSCL